jgi:hypothetical protein
MLMLVIDMLCELVICCGDVRPGSTKSLGPPLLMLVIDMLCELVICCGDVRPGSTKSLGPPLHAETISGISDTLLEKKELSLFHH